MAENFTESEVRRNKMKVFWTEINVGALEVPCRKLIRSRKRRITDIGPVVDKVTYGVMALWCIPLGIATIAQLMRYI